MSTAWTGAVEPPGLIIDEILQGLLSGWAGLQAYIADRRAGGPPDETMDTLLAELLRVGLHEGVDVRAVMASLVASAS